MAIGPSAKKANCTNYLTEHPIIQLPYLSLFQGASPLILHLKKANIS
jgi:hypothetical protein